MNTASSKINESLPLLSEEEIHEAALVVVVFAKTTSKAYPAMLSIAERAWRYTSTTEDGVTHHLVAFDKSRAGARGAIELVGLARSLKGFRIYVRGQAVRNAIRASEVLECYANALDCMNADAWCMEVTRAPYRQIRPPGPLSINLSYSAQRNDKAPMWLFPCRFLLSRGLQVDPQHPASNIEQIDASAIRVGCHWCPRFSPSKLCVLKE